MGAVSYIKSSRKVWKCDKCGSIIEKGQPYYRGEINFGPVFIRCKKCRLKPYEVTTSEFKRSIGELLDTWADTYSLDECGIEDLISALEEIRDDQQDRLDNMPEQLQESSSGEILQERIDMLESAIDDLSNIDIDSIKDDAIDNCDELHSDDPDGDSYDIAYDDVLESSNYSSDIKSALVEYFESEVRDQIDSALSNLEY